MNKAFTREADTTGDHCPHCGSLGQPVSSPTLDALLTAAARRHMPETAYFCPFARCDVAYFDSFERTVPVADLVRPVYPKDPAAPICPCFGLTCDDIEADVAEGVVTRVKSHLAKVQSATTQCHLLAGNGQSCTAEVQRYFMKCRARSPGR